MRVLQLLFVLIVFLSLPAQAANVAEPDHYVKVRILPERGHIQPGEEIWIGVEQSIHPGWHTYWINPGDSGAAPRLEWTLPGGFEISNIHWPAPHKIPYGPLMNYGYEDNVILLQKLRAPETLPDIPLEFSVTAEILVCKDICIPEVTSHRLILNGPESTTEDNSGYLAAARGKLPVFSIHSTHFEEKDGLFTLYFPMSDAEQFEDINSENIEFFPEDWGLVNNAAPQEISIEYNNLVIRQKRGERVLTDLYETGGLLVSKGNFNGTRQALSFSALQAESNVVRNTIAATQAETIGKILKTEHKATLFQALLFALLGGIILNLMPCVFPVLSIKVLSLIKVAEKRPRLARLHGLSYTAGVLLSFIGIAAILISLKTGGAAIGWGFQLQDPVIVTLLAYLLFIIGLNLSGFFEISGHFGSVGNKLAQGEGLTNSFFTGVLATLVATPCTAPFMAGAIGFALIQPAPISLSIFATLGFGLALPYLLLSFVPALQKRLPKPGAWMEVFRQFLAFPMFASAAWLVWVISQQVGPMGVFGLLLGLVAIAFGIWLFKVMPAKGFWKIKLTILAFLSFFIALGFLPTGETPPLETLNTKQETLKFGANYTPQKLARLLQGDDPVFVEMTAAWCITCKLNHTVAIDIEDTRNIFKERNVQYLIGDWTNQDPVITEYLNFFGRNGVPIYVYYGPRDKTGGKRPEPKVLPQILTPGIVKDTVINP